MIENLGTQERWGQDFVLGLNLDVRLYDLDGAGEFNNVSSHAAPSIDAPTRFQASLSLLAKSHVGSHSQVPGPAVLIQSCHPAAPPTPGRTSPEGDIRISETNLLIR